MIDVAIIWKWSYNSLWNQGDSCEYHCVDLVTELIIIKLAYAPNARNPTYLAGMLALFLMHFHAYNAQNYVGIK